MPLATTVGDDVIGDIHDLTEKERADAFKRWIALSELVAPTRTDSEDRRSA